MSGTEHEGRQKFDQGSGITRVLYLVATSDSPKTCSEIAEASEINQQSVRSSMTELYQRGFVIRRNRPTEKRGPDPFEYAVSPRDKQSVDTETDRSGGER